MVVAGLRTSLWVCVLELEPRWGRSGVMCGCGACVVSWVADFGGLRIGVRGEAARCDIPVGGDVARKS